MTVTIKLFATLREGRFDETSVEVPFGVPVATVIEKLAIRPDEAAIVFVNGRHADPQQALAPGDVVSIFPPIGGG